MSDIDVYKRQLEALVERLPRPRPPQAHVKRVFRDGRMFVNAVLNTVRELNALGAVSYTHLYRQRKYFRPATLRARSYA